MKHNNGTIIAEVTKRAKAIEHPPTVSWQAHWLATGYLWANELRAEGLTETADTVEKHLKWFEDNKS